MPAKDGLVSTCTIGACSWLVPLDLDPEADRDAWVDARAAGLGGSEVAAVVNEHPDKSAIDVFLEKTGAAVPFLDNTRTRVGRLLEPTVIGWYAAGHPLWERPGDELVIAKPPTCFHRDRPWQRGSADGLAYLPEQVVTLAPGVELIRSPLRPDHLVEVKTHGWFAARGYERIDNGVPIEIPNDKRIQCAWYMELYDIDRCHLIALVDTHVQKTYVIHRDREVGAYLLEEAERFWVHNVLAGVPPPPDGTESFGRYLSRRFRTHRPDLIASSPAIDAATQRLVRIKRLEKRLEKIRDVLEQEIKTHIGDAAGVKTALGAVTWKLQASGKLKEKDARSELYKIAGMTDAEIEAFEDRYKMPDHRVMRTPR